MLSLCLMMSAPAGSSAAEVQRKNYVGSLHVMKNRFRFSTFIRAIFNFCTQYEIVFSSVCSTQNPDDGNTAAAARRDSVRVQTSSCHNTQKTQKITIKIRFLWFNLDWLNCFWTSRVLFWPNNRTVLSQFCLDRCCCSVLRSNIYLSWWFCRCLASCFLFRHFHCLLLCRLFYRLMRLIICFIVE